MDKDINILKTQAYSLSVKHGLEKEAKLILEEERRLQLLQYEDREIMNFVDGLNPNKTGSGSRTRLSKSPSQKKCKKCKLQFPCQHSISDALGGVIIPKKQNPSQMIKEQIDLMQKPSLKKVQFSDSELNLFDPNFTQKLVPSASGNHLMMEDTRTVREKEREVRVADPLYQRLYED